jgi:hypothetical protein
MNKRKFLVSFRGPKTQTMVKFKPSYTTCGDFVFEV